MTEPDRFGMIDLDTGKLDGFYADEQDARHILEGRREKGERWLLFKAIDFPENSVIPKHLNP